MAAGVFLFSVLPVLAQENDPGEKDVLVLRYPAWPDEYGQSLEKYFVELLHLALSKSGKAYRLEPVYLSEFRETRSVMSIVKGAYDIHWMHTNPRRESILQPVRIPLYKGLIGWRVFMVRREDKDRFSELSDLKELTALKTVQGHEWPDTDILIANGFDVIRAPSWEGMFKMLYAGRVEYFPRSVIEIWREARFFSELDLVVDEHLVLVYPTAYYFFVDRANQVAAEAIEEGLNQAIEDGSFERVLMSHFGDAIKRANLGQRKIIRIENPSLTPQTPVDRSELWYQP